LIKFTENTAILCWPSCAGESKAKQARKLKDKIYPLICTPQTPKTCDRNAWGCQRLLEASPPLWEGKLS